MNFFLNLCWWYWSSRPGTLGICILTHLRSSFLIIWNWIWLNFVHFIVGDPWASIELLFRTMIRFVSSIGSNKTTTKQTNLFHCMQRLPARRHIKFHQQRVSGYCIWAPKANLTFFYSTLVHEALTWHHQLCTFTYLWVEVGSSGPTSPVLQPIRTCYVGSSWWALSSWKMISALRIVCSAHFW